MATFGWISANKFKVPNLETNALTYKDDNNVQQDVKTKIDASNIASNDGELNKLREYTGRCKCNSRFSTNLAADTSLKKVLKSNGQAKTNQDNIASNGGELN